MQSIDEVIRLRDEAIQNLLDEREQLKAELDKVTAELQEINEQLQRLGYADRPPTLPRRTRRGRAMMQDGVYQASYKGQVYILRVENEVMTVDGIDGEFHSLSAAAKAVTKAVTGRKISTSGPRFWKKVE